MKVIKGEMFSGKLVGVGKGNLARKKPGKGTMLSSTEGKLAQSLRELWGQRMGDQRTCTQL